MTDAQPTPEFRVRIREAEPTDKTRFFSVEAFTEGGYRLSRPGATVQVNRATRYVNVRWDSTRAPNETLANARFQLEILRIAIELGARLAVDAEASVEADSEAKEGA